MVERQFSWSQNDDDNAYVNARSMTMINFSSSFFFLSLFIPQSVMLGQLRQQAEHYTS